MKVRTQRRGFHYGDSLGIQKPYRIDTDDDIANLFVSEIQKGDGFLGKISLGMSKVGKKLGITNANWRPPPNPQGSEYEGTEETHYPGANFAGPGTYLKLRLARGDKPTTYMDSVSMKHDIAYQAVSDGIRNGSIRDMKTVEDLIRQADNEMLRELKNDKDFKTSSILRNFVIHKIIYAKTKLEDIKLLHAKQFVNTDALNKNNDVVMVNNTTEPIVETTQEGNGLPEPEEAIMYKIHKSVDEKPEYDCCEGCDNNLGYCERKPAWKLKRNMLNSNRQ